MSDLKFFWLNARGRRIKFSNLNKPTFILITEFRLLDPNLLMKLQLSHQSILMSSPFIKIRNKVARQMTADLFPPQSIDWIHFWNIQFWFYLKDLFDSLFILSFLIFLSCKVHSALERQDIKILIYIWIC